MATSGRLGSNDRRQQRSAHLWSTLVPSIVIEPAIARGLSDWVQVSPGNDDIAEHWNRHRKRDKARGFDSQPSILRTDHAGRYFEVIYSSNTIYS